MVTGPALRQSTVSCTKPLQVFVLLTLTAAEARGPGSRRFGENSDDDFDMDSRTSGPGGRSGRIILLGDGTEVLTDSDDPEMFGHEEIEAKHEDGSKQDETPNRAREDTPAPEDHKTKSEAASADKIDEHQVKAVLDTSAPKQEAKKEE